MDNTTIKNMGGSLSDLVKMGGDVADTYEDLSVLVTDAIGQTDALEAFNLTVSE